MTIIEQIKAEIENALHILGPGYSEMEMGQISAYGHILSFLSNLESENPMDLDGLNEEIKRYIDEYYKADSMVLIAHLAHHFAKWGAEHAMEKMMEESLEGKIFEENYGPHRKVISEWTSEEIGNQGDKVKIIVIHETDIR